jgi:hypothetical protein
MKYLIPTLLTFIFQSINCLFNSTKCCKLLSLHQEIVEQLEKDYDEYLNKNPVNMSRCEMIDSSTESIEELFELSIFILYKNKLILL